MMISSVGTIRVSPDMLLEKISKEVIIFLEAEEGTSSNLGYSIVDCADDKLRCRWGTA